MNLVRYAVLALVVMGTIGAGVHSIKQWGYGEAKAECIAAADKQRAEEAAKSAAAAQQLEAERKKRRVVVQEVIRNVDREVEKVTYRDVCLPSTGVCLANAAINGKVPAGCLSDSPMPAAKPSG